MKHNVSRKLVLINKEVKDKYKNGIFVKVNENEEDDGQSIGEETSLSF